MADLADQPGIVLHGALPQQDLVRLYWRARYWLLPLGIPAAELFCLNALKARHCGATAVVNRVGALQDTVAEWIPYVAFVSGDARILAADAPSVPVLPWNEVVRRYWLPLLLGDL
jgi:hypothetical protein